MEVVRAGIATLVEVDPVELRELVVVTGHHCEVLNDAGLVSQDLNVRGPPLPEQTDLDGFTGA